MSPQTEETANLNINSFGRLPDGMHFILPSWWRLEPRCRKDEFDEGIQARTADPLWYITRQWQWGEFQAEDAGTLCKVNVEYKTERITHHALGINGSYIKTPEKYPLEVLVERETPPITWTWRMRIRAGKQFERYLSEASIPSEQNIDDIIRELYNTYAVRTEDIDGSDGYIDPSSKRLAKLFVNKALNGEKLYNKTHTFTGVLSNVAQKFTTWFNELYVQPTNSANPSWQPETLDYQCKVKSDKDTELSSDQYSSGDLEWYFANHKKTSIRYADEKPLLLEDKLLPNRVTFGGGPDPRWWNLEDGSVDLADLDTAKTDLIKTMFTNFALIHGDDWFTVPLTLPIGSLTKVTRIFATDVFGKVMTIENARVNDQNPLNRWDLFSLTRNDDPKLNAEINYLYIPYSSGSREESEALVEVNFIRDEQANLVFGIEKTMLNGWGKPVSVIDYYREQTRVNESNKENETDTAELESGSTSSETTGADQTQLIYKLATEVPQNWIPYIAKKIDTSENLSQVYLQQARLPDVTEAWTDSPFAPPAPLSKILNESEQLNEEAIPRTGLKVTINAQRFRWVDGKTYVWFGRKVVHANRERSSGLVFDFINE